MLFDPPCRRSPLSPDSFTLLWPCLHPQVQFFHEVPELAFVMAAVPALRYQVTDLYGLAVSAGSLCMALEMLLIASSLPLIAVCISSRTRCKNSAIPCLICCCNVKSAEKAIPACCYIVRLLLLLRISRASKWLHLRWRLSALRYHVKWNSVL